MNKRNVFVALVAVGSFALGAATDITGAKLSRAMRAHQMHEEVDFETTIRPWAAQAGGVAFVKAERAKSWLKQFSELPSVGEIVSVTISSTIDNGRAVVTMTDVDGKKSSFWTTGKMSGKACEFSNARVSAVSPY